MEFRKSLWLNFFIVSAVILTCSAENAERAATQGRQIGEYVGGMIEEGRTMVHHAVKRFQLILPAIFFKLGIAFTMLVVVAIASVTNGVIGFLLLVVGLSSVLARFQEPPRRTSVPYYLPSVHHHAAIHHGWDRNDKRSEDKADTGMTQAYPPQPLQYLYPQVTAYNPGSYAQTMQN